VRGPPTRQKKAIEVEIPAGWESNFCLRTSRKTCGAKGPLPKRDIKVGQIGEMGKDPSRVLLGKKNRPSGNLGELALKEEKVTNARNKKSECNVMEGKMEC